MVLNKPVSEMDEGEPLSEWIDRDPMIQQDLEVGDKIEVVTPGDSFAGKPVRFDAMGGGAAHRGHNILIDADAEDAVDGRIRVCTRVNGTIEVSKNRHGAGMNQTVYKGSNGEVRRAGD